MRPIYFIAGWVMLALGIVGAFVPLMPTTLFLILAAWCFSRSSPRLEAWLFDHPRFGPSLRGWRDHGVISRRAKAMASAGMALGLTIFLIGVHPSLWVGLAASAGMALCALFVLTRPSVPQQR